MRLAICVVTGLMLLAAACKAQASDGFSVRVGVPTPTVFDSTGAYHPEWSPDGRTIAFARHGQGTIEIWLAEIDGKEARHLDTGLNGDCYVGWHPNGETLVFDSYKPGTDGGLYIFTITPGDVSAHLVADLRGGHPSWSPDGERIAFASGEIFTMGRAGDDIRRLTENTADDWHTDWSPAGDWIIFTSDQSGNPDIWKVRPSGGEPVQITTAPGLDDRGSVSPDGRWIAFVSDREGSHGIWITSIDGGEVYRVVDGPGRETMPCWSPDGSQIMFSAGALYTVDIEITDAGA